MIESIHNNLKLISEIDKTGTKTNNKFSFTDLLKENLQEVNQLQQESDKITRDFSLGKIDNIHQVAVTAEKARLALNLTVAIQNKVLDAYKEIMRIQL